LVLVVCVIFLFGGYTLKARCLGHFNERSYKDLCYNDIQPLYGLRLFRTVGGEQQRTFPYIHGQLVGGDLRGGAIEYPVLTGLFMWVSSAPVHDADQWFRISALLLAPFALLTAFLLTEMAGRRALLWAAAPALVLYSFHNWDLLVVAASVTGIWLWWKRRPGWAGVLFGIGAALKMYPILFLAPLVLDRIHARDKKGALVAGGAGLATVVAVNLPFALANWDGWIATYLFHERRGPNFDSIWNLGWPNWTPEHFNLVSGVLTASFFLACLVGGYAIARRRNVYPFVQVCGALLATFLLWNKVHSPQYTLWLLPFFVLLNVSIVWWVAYAIADLAVYVGVFRFFYDYGFQRFDSVAKDVMTVGVWARAGLLLCLVVVFLTARSRGEPDDPVPARAPGEPSQSPASLVSAASIRPTHDLG
jgi:uncharacterized membrane protein